MQNFSFPKWSGPVVGAVVGILVALQSVRLQVDVPILYLLAGGAILGALAGCFMLLLDPPEPDSESMHDVGFKSPGRHKSSRTGTVLAVLCIVTSWVPVIGFFVGVAAVYVNFRATNWTRLTSIIGFGVSVIMLVPVVIIVAGALIDPPR